MKKNYLNLDSILDDESTIKIKEKEYKLPSLPVVEYSRIQLKLRELDDYEKIVEVVDFVYKICPGAKKDNALEQLTPSQMEKFIMFFIAGFQTTEEVKDESVDKKKQ